MNTTSDRVSPHPGLHSSAPAAPALASSPASTTPEAQPAPTVKGAFGHHFRAPVQRLVVKMGRDTRPDVEREPDNYANVMEVDEAAEVAAAEVGGPIVRFEDPVPYYDEKKAEAPLGFVGHGNPGFIGEVPPAALGARIAHATHGLPGDAKTPIYLYACNAGDGKLADTYAGKLMQELTKLDRAHVRVHAPKGWLAMLRPEGRPPARAVYRGGDLLGRMRTRYLQVLDGFQREGLTAMRDAARDTRLRRIHERLEKNQQALAEMEKAAKEALSLPSPSPSPLPSGGDGGGGGGGGEGATAVEVKAEATAVSTDRPLLLKREYVTRLRAEYDAEAKRVEAARRELPGKLREMWAAVRAAQVELIAAAEARAGGGGGEAKGDPVEWAGASFNKGWMTVDAMDLVLAAQPDDLPPPPPPPSGAPAPTPTGLPTTTGTATGTATQTDTLT